MLSGLKLLLHHEQIKRESGLSESASLIIRLLLMGKRKLISHATYIAMAGEGQGIFHQKIVYPIENLIYEVIVQIFDLILRPSIAGFSFDINGV